MKNIGTYDIASAMTLAPNSRDLVLRHYKFIGLLRPVQ